MGQEHMEKKPFICLFVILNLINDGIANRNIRVAFLNRKIDTSYRMEKVEESLLYSCANMCMYRTDCVSISFNQNTRICELYKINSSTAASDGKLVEGNTTVTIDISDWTQGKTGGCWDRPCPTKTLCVPNGEAPVCHSYGCPQYSLPEHGKASGNDDEFVAVGQKILVGCHLPYLTSIVDPAIYWVLTCRPDGNWGWTYTCLTIEELCTHYILEKLISNLNITVTSNSSSTWSPTDILFASTTAWTTDQNVSYVQVQFEDTKWIGGVATKGGNNSMWVRRYMVSYSVDCDSYHVITHSNGTTMIFDGNSDMDTVVENHFEEPVKLKCIHIHPVEYNIAVAMRMELLACEEY